MWSALLPNPSLARRCLPLYLLLLSIVLAPGAARADDRDWEPAKTWVFVVGTLSWQDKESFGSFEVKNRRDAELVRFFRDEGVPGEQIVYLQDRAATTANIEQSLKRLLSRTRPDDMLVLYYCGHGYKEERGAAYFASYDASDEVKDWPMASVPAAIEAGFKGSSALLLADCCYSGMLAKAVEKQHAGRVSLACLTSSSASQLSTGNWTFTEAILDGLRGLPGCDLDGDGDVTLQELAAYAAADMSFGEEQLASFAHTGDFTPDTVLAEAQAEKKERVGERVEVSYEGSDWKARIVDVKPDRYQVHWLGVKDYPDEWVDAGQVHFPQAKAAKYAAGACVEVEWKKKWYPARILEARGSVYRVHYDGYDDEWDEWVSSKRIRPPQE